MGKRKKIRVGTQRDVFQNTSNSVWEQKGLKERNKNKNKKCLFVKADC